MSFSPALLVPGVERGVAKRCTLQGWDDRCGPVVQVVCGEPLCAEHIRRLECIEIVALLGIPYAIATGRMGRRPGKKGKRYSQPGGGMRVTAAAGGNQ